MGHVRTAFDSEFRIPTSFLGHHLNHRGHHHHGGIATSTLTNIKTPSGTVTKVETSYFSFAGFDWNIALYPNGIKEAHGKLFCIEMQLHLLNFKEEIAKNKLILVKIRRQLSLISLKIFAEGQNTLTYSAI